WIPICAMSSERFLQAEKSYINKEESLSITVRTFLLKLFGTPNSYINFFRSRSNECMPSISLEAIFLTLVVFIIFFGILVVILSLRKKERCPVCGATWLEKTPKQWTIFGIPVTFRNMQYKYRCRKCQHEWEG
ncbi:MAG: hypothetical protein O2U62_07265, partial [Candidatus Bathyarchaeota archaeon]|nr:hypothetical protein [Candidatus Bathyarchaeota archaeon]